MLHTDQHWSFTSCNRALLLLCMAGFGVRGRRWMAGLVFTFLSFPFLSFFVSFGRSLFSFPVSFACLCFFMSPLSVFVNFLCLFCLPFYFLSFIPVILCVFLSGVSVVILHSLCKFSLFYTSSVFPIDTLEASRRAFTSSHMRAQSCTFRKGVCINLAPSEPSCSSNH